MSLVIEGRIFKVIRDEIKVFDSDFLNRLVDPDSPFSPPVKKRVYVINGRNATYFEAFFRLLTGKKPSAQNGFGGGRFGGRCGLIPSVLKCHIAARSDDKLTKYILQEADSWGVRDRVERYLSVTIPSAVKVIQRAFYRCVNTRDLLPL